MTPRLFTLEAARQQLARQECDTHGHDIDFVHHAGTTDPVTAHCSRGCGHHGWRMVPILCPPGHPLTPDTENHNLKEEGR